MMRVAIIGLGVGEAHIAGYHKHSQSEVVALCDFNEAKRQDVASRHPEIDMFADADDILLRDDIDIVSIASYDNYHHEQIIKALRSGKHVFVEKPLCLHSWEAKEIRSALREAPHLRLSSNLILRKTPRFQELSSALTRGEYGDVFQIEGDYNYGRVHKITDGWRGTIPYYSVMLGGGVHLIDLMTWLTGKKIQRVSAFGSNMATRHTAFRYPDTVVSILEFEDGLIGKVSANFSCVYPHFHRLSVYGTKATFQNHLPNALKFESRDPAIQPNAIDSAYPGTHKGDMLYSFVDSVLGVDNAEVSEEDVFAAVSVCFAINQSLDTRRVVEVEYI
jgi:predicted dehydrogenase